MSAIKRRKLIKLLLLLAAVAVIVGLAAGLLRGCSHAAPRGGSNRERVSYLRSLGYSVEPEPLAEETLLLPEPFPDVLREYNRLQLRQGFDLEKLAGKEVTMYTYRVIGPETGDEVECSLYVYRNRIVGGDIHSTAFDGFMKELVPSPEKGQS